MSTEQQLQKILTRNARVEADKRWETSWTRRIFITVLTFFAAYLFLELIHADNSILAALVPTGGYFLSTLKISPLRKIWEHFNK